MGKTFLNLLLLIYSFTHVDDSILCFDLQQKLMRVNALVALPI